MNEFAITEEVKAQLSKAESMEDVVEILAQAGVSVTKEQLEAQIALENAEGELSEENLDAVAGGAKLISILRYILPLLPGPILPHFPKYRR